MSTTSIKQKILLVIFGLILCALLLEAGLRVAGFTLSSLQEHRNQISLKKHDAYRILCLGESTTALGNDGSYPSQLEGALNEWHLPINFSVINAGKGGTNSGVIVSRLQANLKKYNPDMVIVMMGINDRDKALMYEKVPKKDGAVSLESFRVFELIKLLKLHIVNKYQELNGFKWRGQKRKAEKVNEFLELGKQYEESKSFYEAEEMYKKAIEADPKDQEIYFRLGRVFYLQDSYDKAIAMYRRAIELDPGNARGYLELGRFYWRNKQFDDAEDLFKKAIGICPLDPESYDMIGALYHSQDYHVKAIGMLRKSIELNPDNFHAYLILGKSYWNINQFDKSYEMFLKSAELNPQENKVYGRIAHYFNKQKDYSLAEEYFKKAEGDYSPVTRHNYQALKKILDRKGIKLVCVQYPIRRIAPLRDIFADPNGIIYVDNEKVFKDALKASAYDEYFTDFFAGDFGHCTPKGNLLLAENIARSISEYFRK